MIPINAPTSPEQALKYGFRPLPPEESIFHRIGNGNEYNLKMVHNDGREIIYNKNRNIVTEYIIIGTRNDTVIKKGDMLSYVLHGIQDVFPYLILGNTPSDSPNLCGFIRRLLAKLIYSVETPDDYLECWSDIYNFESG